MNAWVAVSTVTDIRQVLVDASMLQSAWVRRAVIDVLFTVLSRVAFVAITTVLLADVIRAVAMQAWRRVTLIKRYIYNCTKNYLPAAKIYSVALTHLCYIGFAPEYLPVIPSPHPVLNRSVWLTSLAEKGFQRVAPARMPQPILVHVATIRTSVSCWIPVCPRHRCGISPRKIGPAFGTRCGVVIIAKTVR